MNDPSRRLVESSLQRLSEWSCGVSTADVPDDVLRKVALVVLDDFGAMTAAREEPELKNLRQQIEAASGSAEATIFDGGARKLDRYNAALSNGSAVTWCELDGGFRPAACHAAAYVLPAVLAEAEAVGSTVNEMILAVLVGYETVSRIARAFVFPPFRIHPHAGLATIGAAAAVAKLRGYSPALTAMTINSAATLVLPGPFKHAVDGALIRNVWPGVCAQNGLRAADWASIGISGTGTSLADVLSNVFGAHMDTTELSAGLDENWAVIDGYHKMHACCQYAHSTVEAICDALGDTAPPDPAQVHEIRIETHESARSLNNADPMTTLAAKFSIQHIASATLVLGHAGASAFCREGLKNLGIAALRRKVKIAPYEPVMPPPNDRPARVTITLRDGRKLAGECLSAQGGRDRPFAEEQIKEKIRCNLEAAYPGSSYHLLPLVERSRDACTVWRVLVAEFTQARELFGGKSRC